MSTYYAGNLPQGSSIVYELNPEYTYIANPSRTLCFPFKMRRNYQQLVVELADTTPFENCFIPVVRAWPSTEASGISLTASPRYIQNTINLPPTGVKYNFWLSNEVNQEDLVPASINHAIYFGQQYWMNVQNLQNKTSYFYCKFTFYGKGIEYSQ
jgi:hypothetical protein